MTTTTVFGAVPHGHIDAGPGSLAYWRFGRGPDVVLVHGWPLHAATFRALVPLLAPHFTLHVFDLPRVGHSLAWPRSGRSTFHELARALRAAINGLDLGPYALLSHDSGGVITRLVAAEDPRVQAMVMGNTELPNHVAWQVKAIVKTSKVPGLAESFLSAMRVRALRRLPLAFGGCFDDQALIDGEFADLFIEPLLRDPAKVEGQLALVRDLDFDVIRALGDVHARAAYPTLLLWGRDDPFFPLAKAKQIVGGFQGGAELTELPGKLYVHEEEPEAFAEHTTRFLRRTLS